MATKTCKKCGWEVDKKSPLSRCPICKTIYTEGYCKICGGYCTDDDFVKGLYCRDCFNEYLHRPPDRKHKAKVSAKRTTTYKQWMSLIDKVPKDYHTLTEPEWLEACQYFNGCAICGAEDISARGYFIPFKYGGRYCNWNIIPMCEKCATRMQSKIIAANTKDPLTHYMGHSDDFTTLKHIMEYLEVKLNAATK